MEEELADVLYYVLALANVYEIDLEAAYLRKQAYRIEKNKIENDQTEQVRKEITGYNERQYGNESKRCQLYHGTGDDDSLPCAGVLADIDG